MRNLTETEIIELYDNLRCPFCKSTDFYKGSLRELINTNWYCANEECGAGFNLTQKRGSNGQVIRESKLITNG